MTELETMQRAKIYLDKLANGIDPLTDQLVSDTDCINQVRISRCLFFVSDILRKVIENGGVIGKREKVKKRPFSISFKTLTGFPLSDTPIPVSEITNRINALVDQNAMTKLKHTSINTFLLQSGFLEETDVGNGKKAKRPTARGNSVGIYSEERIGQAGTYHVTVYNTEAQQFVLDSIEAIIKINSQKSALSKKHADLQGQPWTGSYDETLIDLFRKGVPVPEIAITLKRTEGGVHSRLKKLGLINSEATSTKEQAYGPDKVS